MVKLHPFQCMALCTFQAFFAQTNFYSKIPTQYFLFPHFTIFQVYSNQHSDNVFGSLHIWIAEIYLIPSMHPSLLHSGGMSNSFCATKRLTRAFTAVERAPIFNLTVFSFFQRPYGIEIAPLKHSSTLKTSRASS